MGLKADDKITINVLIKGTITVRRDSYGDSPLFTDEDALLVEREQLADGWYGPEELFSILDEDPTIEFNLS